MSVVNLPVSIPREFEPTQLSSTSDAILRKSLHEISPDDQNIFAYSGNKNMRFTVASRVDFLKGQESFFRMNVKRNDGDVNYNNKASVDVGGVLSLFKSVEIKGVSSQQRLDFLNYSNRFHALKSLIHQSPTEVEYLLFPYGDSMSDQQYNADPYNNGYKAISFTAANLTVSIAGAVDLGAGGRALSEIEVGDFLLVRASIAGSYVYARVNAIATDSTLTLDHGPSVAIVGDAANVAFVHKSKEQTPARIRVVQTSGTDFIVEFRFPHVSYLNMDLPLFLMGGGIEIDIELEDPNRALKTGLDLQDSATNLNYEISNARFYAMMVTPHSAVANALKQQWASEGGVNYATTGVRSLRFTRDAGTANENISMRPGRRSCKKVYTIVQDSNISESSDTLGKANRSISTSLRSSINKWQYKSGSSEYPNRAIVCDDYSTECLQHLYNVAEKEMKMAAEPPRFSPSDWFSVNSIKVAADTAVVGESLFWCMAAELGRDKGKRSIMSGLDLSHVPLEMELERSQAYNGDGLTGSPVYYTWIEHDQILHLSEKNGMVVIN